MLVVVAGCTTSLVRSDANDPEQVRDVVEEVRRIGEFVKPFGLNWTRVESVALVTELAATGSDPPPTSRRAVLIADMQAREVRNPNNVLASPTTSLVLASAYLPPGVKKGDPLDIEVRTSSKSETTSLRRGWLMPTRLKEMAVLGNEIVDGHVLAHANGAVLIDSYAKGTDDSVNEVRGRVLGGGVSLQSRNLKLVVRTDKESVRLSALIGAVVNKRFHGYDRGLKEGMAVPKTDKYVELAVHPRYGDNIPRYVRVVLNIPLRLSASKQIKYLQRLEEQLQDPESAQRAALRLEAVGQSAADTLAVGLDVPDPATSFYAAEALAYLDDERGVKSLARAAVDQSQFRLRAITALGAMDQAAAYDELVELLHVKSAQARYAAFRVLKRQNPRDPFLAGKDMEGRFTYHVVASSGEPMVHISRVRHPEIVAFGHQIEMNTPFMLFADKNLLVDGREPGTVKLSCFKKNGADVHEYCSAKLEEILRGIVQVGGTYSHAIQFLQNAKSNKLLPARLVFDSVPHHRRPKSRHRREEVEVAARDTYSDSGPSGELADESKEERPESRSSDAIQGKSQESSQKSPQPR